MRPAIQPPDAQKPRSAPLSLALISRRDLETGVHLDRWDDPAGLVAMTPAKTSALLTNPLATRAADEPMQIIAVADETAVGRIDVLAGQIDREGEVSVPCVWGSHLTVPERYRSTGAGIKLVAALAELRPAVGASALSDIAYRIFGRLKWTDLSMPRYVLLRRTRSVLESYVGSGTVARVTSRTSDVALAAIYGVAHTRSRLRARKLEPRGVNAFPPSLLGQRPVARHLLGPYHGPDWIDWMLGASFFEADARNWKRLYCVHSRSDGIVAYFVVRSKHYATAAARFRDVVVGSLVEWEIFDPDVTFENIVALTIDVVGAADVDAVEVIVPPEGAGTALGRMGFRRVGDFRVVFKTTAPPLDRTELKRPESWRLRPAAGDGALG